jgi:hypothetical protein
MPKYRVQYDIVSEMTQIIEADSHFRALEIAKANEGGGKEEKAYTQRWYVEEDIEQTSTINLTKPPKKMRAEGFFIEEDDDANV